MPVMALVGKVRRAWLSVFRREYVREQHSRRRGECRQCGQCCRLLYRCPFLTADNRCLIYRLPRPGNCRDFPLDPRDLRELRHACGYSFEGCLAPPPRRSRGLTRRLFSR